MRSKRCKIVKKFFENYIEQEAISSNSNKKTDKQKKVEQKKKKKKKSRKKKKKGKKKKKKKKKKQVLPRFELGSWDSESQVLTVTPQNHYWRTFRQTIVLFWPQFCI